MALALCTSIVFTLRLQLSGDLFVAVPLRDKPQHLGFPHGCGGASAPGALALLGGKRRSEMVGQRGIDVLSPSAAARIARNSSA